MCDFMKRTLGLTLLFSFGYSYYLCNMTGETWEQATKHCFRYGKLLTEDNFKEIDTWELVKANMTEFWTSNIIEVAHAVEYKGCYLESAAQSKTPVIPIGGGINLVDCQRACNRNGFNSFYGLHGDKCACSYRIFDKFDFSKQSCFQNCSIEYLEFCKDSKRIAIYKRISDDSIALNRPNITTSKCVARVNTMVNSTENCQKNLHYQCRGSIKNGTFLNALEDCGEEWIHDHYSTNTFGDFWKPVFFPTLDRIKNTLSDNKNHLKTMICKSLKVDGNHTYIKQRNCSELLPYICKTDDDTATPKRFKMCPFQIRQTSSLSTTTHAFSTPNDVHTTKESTTGADTSSSMKTTAIKNSTHTSNVPFTRANTHEAKIDTNHVPTTLHQFSTSSTTKSVPDNGIPNKWLIVGIACGAGVIVLTVIIIFIVRKRCTGMKQNEKGLGAVNLQTVSDNNEEHDVLYDENISPYSVSVSVNPTLVANQGNVVYAVVNKPKQTDNRNGDCYSLATPISSTPVERENNGGTAALYAEVNKVKKKTTKGAPENNTGNNINITESETASGYNDNKLMHTGCNSNKNVSAESKLLPGNGVTYHVSTGTDYDHLNFRGSKHTDELPVESDGLYDHAAVGHERGDDMYDGVQRDVEQHGTNDTYDHVSALR